MNTWPIKRRRKPAKYKSLHYKVIPGVPESSTRRGPRRSDVLLAVEAAMQAPQGTIEVRGDTSEELVRFYLRLMQWMHRHRDRYPDITVKKDGDHVYILYRPQSPTFDLDIEPWLGTEVSA